MTDKKEWYCSHCNRSYTFDEFMNLEKALAQKGDIDHKYGYVAICKCGKHFHTEKWRMLDRLKIKNKEEDVMVDIDVSTIHLELIHFGFLYETMVLVDDYMHESAIQRRYKTKEEAIEGHNDIVKRLKDGDFEFVVCKYRLEMSHKNKDER